MKKFQILQKSEHFSIAKVHDTKTGKKWFSIRVETFVKSIDTSVIEKQLGPDHRFVSGALEWRYHNRKSAERIYTFLLMRWQ